MKPELDPGAVRIQESTLPPDRRKVSWGQRVKSSAQQVTLSTRQLWASVSRATEAGRQQMGTGTRGSLRQRGRSRRAVALSLDLQTGVEMQKAKPSSPEQRCPREAAVTMAVLRIPLVQANSQEACVTMEHLSCGQCDLSNWILIWVLCKLI